jgi:GTPase SAR1 family protein
MNQDQAFQILTMGKNVLLTGAAGSGKTFLMNRYITLLSGTQHLCGSDGFDGDCGDAYWGDDDTFVEWDGDP